MSKGWYYVSITDSGNCFVSDSIFIDHPDTLQFDIISKKPETCMGVSYDGEIHLEIMVVLLLIIIYGILIQDFLEIQVVDLEILYLI